MTKVVRNVVSALKEGRFKTKADGTKYIEVPKDGWNLQNQNDLEKFEKVVNDCGFSGWKLESIMANYDSSQLHHYELILSS